MSETFETYLDSYGKRIEAVIPLSVSADGRTVLPGPLRVGDAQNVAVQGAVVLTVSGSDVTPGRGVWIECSVAGTANFKLADGSFLAVSLQVGPQMLPFAVKAIVTSSATAVFSNLV